MNKKTTDPFYSTWAWRAAREDALDRDGGCCVRCRAAGRYACDRHGRRIPVRATLVHHREPLRERPDLALTLSNLESLCDRCHDEAHPEKLGHKKEAIPEIAKGIAIARL